MEKFDLTHIDDYTIEQLADFVIAGKTTVQELYDEGLFRPLRAQLLKELEARDNIAWKEAVANGTIDAIDGYIAVFNQPSPHYQGSHVEEAKELKAQLEQAAVTRDAKPEDIDSFESVESFDADVDETTGDSVDNVRDSDNQDSENTTDGKVDSFEHAPAQQENSVTREAEMPGAEISEVSSENDKKPIKIKIPFKNIKKWGFISLIAIIVVILIPVLLHFINEKEEAVPLTQDEIAEIIKNYQDSLKTDIFDGFYLIPAVWDGISRNYPIPLPGEEGFQENQLHPTYSADDSIHANPPHDVIALFKGRFDVINKNGSRMPLPGVSNGIDSLLVINKPFIEYIDDNGLRRVVALLNNDLYYYAGYCGTHDGFRQYVLINRTGKYGLVDENCTILEDFFNEKITISSNGYYVKNGSTNQFHNFDGDVIKSSNETSATNSNSKKSLPVLSNYYDKARGLWGYKDENGKIVIPAKFKSCPWRFDETITDVRLSNDKVAFIDRKGKILVTFKSIDNYFTSAGNVKIKGDNGKYGIYNKSKLTFTLAPIYDEVTIYGDNTNMFPVKKDGKWGYVKAGGEEVIPFKFKAASTFNSNLAAVQNDDGKWGYIDMSGNYKIQPQYSWAGTMSAEGACVMRSSNEYGYITKSGSLIASWYPYMSNKFVLDRIFVRNNENLGGFVDKNNKLVIPYLFEETTSAPAFSEVTHLAKVRFKGMDWYVNTNGAFSIPVCIYVDAIDKKRSRDWDDGPNRKGATRKKVAKEVIPTKQSIPELMLRITEISEQTSQEIANEENKSKSKEKRYKK